MPLVCLSGCLFGLWWGGNLKADLVSYQQFIGQTLEVKGRVSEDSSFNEKGEQRIRLDKVVISGQELKGQIWISTGKAEIKRGDHIKVYGKLTEGFGSLSATIYRANVLEITRPYPGDIARRVRDWFGAAIRQSIPEPEVNLGLGYLVGQKTALPPDLEENIRLTGLTHVVVASGYNLTILVLFCRRLFLKVSKFMATYTSVLLVFSFMFVTGLSPSMTRAGFVACLGLATWYFGRSMHPFVLLSFAAAVTALINPSYVWGDLGWYLSFLAFIGVLVLAPLFHRYFWGEGEPSTIRGLLVETSSAQIITLPFILFSFGLFATYALPANLLVLPFVPLAMLATFIAGIVSLIMPGFADLIGLPATLILKYSVWVINKFASLPGSQFEIAFNLVLMLVSYIVIGLLILYLIRRTKHDFRSIQVEKYF